MNFKELNIENSYESDCGNLIEVFYEPVLNCATKYYRLAGFFSSSSLAIAARGLSEFIKKEGKYFLVCSPILSLADAKILEQFINSDTLDIDIDLSNIKDEFEENHVKALGWMLKKHLLEIKLAVLYDENNNIMTSEEVINNGIFHQKVGIMYDEDGNFISFSGSVNESANAWLNNDEEFKVFRSWDISRPYAESDLIKFQSYWLNDKKKVKIYNLSEAVKSKLIKYSKDFNSDIIKSKNYINHKKNIAMPKVTDIPLFSYQKEAVNKWISHDYNLLFEMATGTGKTRTAIACIAHLLNKKEKLVIIVSCPQNTLAKQWGDELRALGIKTDVEIFADSTNPKWKDKLETHCLEIQNGFANTLLILTTHATSSSSIFTNILEQISSSIDTVFIGDETHWLGAKKLQKALLPCYKYRVGLSATPTRWFDDIGSTIILSYYGSENFEFSIEDALYTLNPLTQKPFLVTYEYHLLETTLTIDEGLEYKKLTAQIINAYKKRNNSERDAEIYQNLLIKRSNIIKNAENKFSELETLLKKLNKTNDGIRDLIIFVSPQQLDKVKEILIHQGIIFHQLTEKQGVRKSKKYGGLSEREYILKCFKKGLYQVLVAIKCLDEGIDIPSASKAILMASSTNPREYIQRIGRIIRQSPEKQRAYLYDMAVLECNALSDEETNFDKKIREKEINRIREISKTSINPYETEKIINNYYNGTK